MECMRYTTIQPCNYYHVYRCYINDYKKMKIKVGIEYEYISNLVFTNLEGGWWVYRVILEISTQLPIRWQ